MGDSSAAHLLVLNASEGRVQFVIARWSQAILPGEPSSTGDEFRPELLCAQAWHAPSQGAELLAPALSRALERLKISPRDIGRIAVVRGPGSFTGIRLVLATAAGLTRATGALGGGIEYLPLLACNALHLTHAWREASCSPLSAQPEDGSPVWVLTHARRSLVHMQGFIAVPASSAEVLPRPLTGIEVVSPEQAVALISAVSPANAQPLLILGSGLSRNRQTFKQLLAAVQASSEGNALLRPVLLPEEYDHPHESTLLRTAVRADYGTRDIDPLYARPADAEDNLERIAASLGLDPAQARRTLDSILTRAWPLQGEIISPAGSRAFHT